MDIKAIVAEAHKHGWQEVFNMYEKLLPNIAIEKQGLFCDAFFFACLELVDDATPEGVLWYIANNWYKNRKIPAVDSQTPSQDENSAYIFISLSRETLQRRLPFSSISKLAFDSAIASSLITFWMSSLRQVSPDFRHLALPVLQ
jgi:hypothetical protein